MSSTLIANVRASLAYTVQAIRYAESALAFFQELSPFPFSPNPIKEQFYQDTIESLVEGYLAIKALPFDTQFPSDPVFPNAPLISPAQENPLLIKLSDNRAALALEKNNDAIKYIKQSLLLSDENDSLSGQLLFIRITLTSARDAMTAGLNSPDFIMD